MKPVLPISVALLLISACGSPQPDPYQGTPTPTPTPTATVTPGSSDYALEKFAKITASSEDSALFRARNIADDLLGNSDSTLSYQVWIPEGNPNDDWIKLEWNSSVQVSSIKLWDLPTVGQVTSGQVKFIAKDSSVSIEPVNFTALPDDAKTALSITAPSQAIIGMEVRILSHKKEPSSSYGVGIADVEILGHRVDEAIGSSNIAPYSRIPKLSENGYSSAYQAFQNLDVGPNQASNIKDGSSSYSWVSNGNGGSAFVRMEFDRTYDITELTLRDLSGFGASHFTAFTVRFPDLNKKYDFTKDSGAASVTVKIPEATEAKLMEISITAATSANSGLAEVEVTGSYDP